MSASLPPDRQRDEYLFHAKAQALAAIAGDGPQTAAALFLDVLGRHPDLRAKRRLLAFLGLDARQTIVPAGSPAVRAWIEGFTWPAEGAQPDTSQGPGGWEEEPPARP